MAKTLINTALVLLTAVFWLVPVDFAAAHHVLGRPAYSLNEDSNTPPSMQAEVRIGDYLVTYLAFPAFPRPGAPGRINLYVTRNDDGTPLTGKVTFKAREDAWFSWLGLGGNEVTLGIQSPDDAVFRQGYRFHAAGDYIISAEFVAEGEGHVVDFPLRVGEPPLIGPIGVVFGIVLAVLLGVGVAQRRRSMTGKIRGAHEKQTGTEAAMKRRDFFRLGARKAAEVTAQLASQKVAWHAEAWLRPPFAQEELNFLLACTRCDKCIEACDFDVLFKLPADLGRTVAGTPAMDLLNWGCHLCSDWPCVKACEPEALKRPHQSNGLVKLARVRIEPDACLPYAGPECGACAHSCPVPGALEWEGGVRPVINNELCTGCALCREACIVDSKAIAVSAPVSRAHLPAASVSPTTPRTMLTP